MTKIKICGIKTLPDALAAIQTGADLLGFNFYPKSPRYIEPETCAEITSILREKHPSIILVGVFVNSPIPKIRVTLEIAHLDLAQLHGDETPEMLAELGSLGFKAIRLPSSVSVRDSVMASVDQSVSVRESATKSADQPALLIDSSAPGLYGGSGLTTDWDAAAQIASRLPVLLAGGLTPENVAEAIQKVHPWGVDVASGVESAPGVKDPAKMHAFVKAVRDTR